MSMSRKLLRWGARRCFAAEPLRERFEEEWLADLDEVPRRLAKLAHVLGVLLFTVVPLLAMSRWERSQLAEWLNRVQTRLRPMPGVVSADGGLALARACAVALSLALTGLVAVLSVQGTLRILRTPAAPAGVTGVPGEWYRITGANGSGEAAFVYYRSLRWGTQLEARVVGVPVGTTVQLSVISADGKYYLVGTWTTDAQENSVWYQGAAAIAGSLIKSLEVTAGTAPPVVITVAAGAP